jgi:dihydropteroate synthase
MRITSFKINTPRQAEQLITSLGVSRQAIAILSPKSISLAFKIQDIRSWEANVIKQHLLSLGTDCAINRAALIKNIKTDILIFGNVSQLNKLCEKLKNQPFSLNEISHKLKLYLDNFLKEEFILCIRGKILKVKKPLICGIINVTPDSFSGDGLLRLQVTGCPSTSLRVNRLQDLILGKAEKMIKEGAKIIDVGGESSRPFSKPISENEEIKRVISAIRAIRKEFKNIIISIDTYKFKVAKQAAEAGVDIINDITALRRSPQITGLIKKYKLGCILMHMKGSPANMQINPQYKDVTGEIVDFFSERIDFCEKAGIDKEQLLLDPGIGFGKKLKDNLKIINELYKFKIFGLPIFLGLSRKSFLGRITKEEPSQRVLGTAVANALAYFKGAHIFRVHDVKETTQALKIASAILHN